MIRKSSVLFASIVLSLLLVVGFASAAITDDLLDDGFESGLANWTAPNGATLTTNLSYVNSGSQAVLLQDAGSNEQIISLDIDTTGYENIVVSYYRLIENIEVGDGDEFRFKYSVDGGSNFDDGIIETSDDGYTQNSFSLPASAEDNSQVQLKFALKADDSNDLAAVDDVLVTGDLIDVLVPEVENVTVDPSNPLIEDVLVTADVTDENSGIDSVSLTCSVVGEITSITKSMSLESGDTYSASISAGSIDADDGDEVECTITAEDNDGNSETTSTFTYVYDGEDPTADFTCDVLSGPEALVTTCTSTSSDSVTASGDLVYSWDFGNGDTSTGESPSAVNYTTDGEYTVSLTVTDEAGRSDTLTRVDYIVVSDTTPTVDFTSTSPENEGSVMTFEDMSTSYDGIVSWSWDFGNGDTSTDEDPSYTYNDNGTYTVELTVEEADGDTDTITKNVTVNDLGPTADAGLDQTIEEGNTISVNGSGSTSSPDAIILYEWDWTSNGTYDSTGLTATSPVYDSGTYTVTLRVTDDDGSQDTNTLTVTVTDIDPVAEFSSDSPKDEGSVMTFEDLSTSYDGIVSYSWDFGDGSGTSTDEDPSYTYTDDGTYTVTLTINESDGDIDTVTHDVIVNNVAPTFDNLPSTEGAVVSEAFSYDVDASDVVDTLTYSLSGEPSGMTIDSGTGVISWTPSASQGGEDYSVTVTIDDGTTTVDETLEIHVYDYSIDLSTDWTLISMPLVPADDNTSTESVFSNVLDNVDVIWSYEQGEWKVYDGVATSLTDVVPGYGYYVKMNESDTLLQDGEKLYGNDGFTVPKPPVVTLTPSWNLIGHYGINTVAKDDAFTTIPGVYSTLLNQSGSPMGELESEIGYWLFVTGNDDVSYAPSDDAYDF